MLAFWSPGPMEILIIGVVALLIFGGRLPSVMKNLGKGIVEFKKGVRGIENEVDNASTETDYSTSNSSSEESSETSSEDSKTKSD